ncbi:hypothetical protein HDU93_009871 [Gonapodya sp. JEL0774]|nr:hypothetical protein HDU93_009871 [Gonapodya sp. JEL0774]
MAVVYLYGPSQYTASIPSAAGVAASAMSFFPNTGTFGTTSYVANLSAVSTAGAFIGQRWRTTVDNDLGTYSTAQIQTELQAECRLIQQATGKVPKYLILPGQIVTSDIQAVAASMGYSTLGVAFDLTSTGNSLSGTAATTAACTSAFNTTLQDQIKTYGTGDARGGVLWLSDASNAACAVAGASATFARLTAAGYTPVSVSTCLGDASPYRTTCNTTATTTIPTEVSTTTVTTSTVMAATSSSPAALSSTTTAASSSLSPAVSASTSASPSAENDKATGGVSSGVLGGAIGGAAALAFLLVGVGFFLYRRRKQDRDPRDRYGDYKRTDHHGYAGGSGSPGGSSRPTSGHSNPQTYATAFRPPSNEGKDYHRRSGSTNATMTNSGRLVPPTSSGRLPSHLQNQGQYNQGNVRPPSPVYGAPPSNYPTSTVAPTSRVDFGALAPPPSGATAAPGGASAYVWSSSSASDGGPPPDPGYVALGGRPDESTVQVGAYYVAVESWQPENGDEVAVTPGEAIYVWLLYRDGWCIATNLTTLQLGNLPFVILQPSTAPNGPVGQYGNRPPPSSGLTGPSTIYNVAGPPSSRPGYSPMLSSSMIGARSVSLTKSALAGTRVLDSRAVSSTSTGTGWRAGGGNGAPLSLPDVVLDDMLAKGEISDEAYRKLKGAVEGPR